MWTAVIEWPWMTLDIGLSGEYPPYLGLQVNYLLIWLRLSRTGELLRKRRLKLKCFWPCPDSQWFKNIRDLLHQPERCPFIQHSFSHTVAQGGEKGRLLSRNRPLATVLKRCWMRVGIVSSYSWTSMNLTNLPFKPFKLVAISKSPDYSLWEIPCSPKHLAQSWGCERRPVSLHKMS